VVDYEYVAAVFGVCAQHFAAFVDADFVVHSKPVPPNLLVELIGQLDFKCVDPLEAVPKLSACRTVGLDQLPRQCVTDFIGLNS